MNKELLKLRYENGESCSKIALDFNVTPAAIRYHIIKCGGTMRTKSETKLAELNPNFRGLNAKTIGGLHRFIRKLMPPTGICAKCSGSFETLDLANITGEYSKSINDWIYLCRKCHMEMDNRIYNLKQLKNLTNQSMQIANRHGWHTENCG